MKDMRGLYYTLLGTFVIQSLLVVLLNMRILGAGVKIWWSSKFLTLSLMKFFTQYLVFMLIFLGVALIIGVVITKKSRLSPATAGVVGVNLTYLSLITFAVIKAETSSGAGRLALGMLAGILLWVFVLTAISSIIAGLIVKKFIPSE